MSCHNGWARGVQHWPQELRSYDFRCSHQDQRRGNVEIETRRRARRFWSSLQVDTTLTFRRRNSDCLHQRCISFPLILFCSLQILSRGNLWILCLGLSMHHVVLYIYASVHQLYMYVLYVYLHIFVWCVRRAQLARVAPMTFHFRPWTSMERMASPACSTLSQVSDLRGRAEEKLLRAPQGQAFTAKAASQLKFSRCHTPMSWRIWNIPFISTFRPLPGNNWNILKLWCAPGYFTSLLQDLVPDLTNFYNQWPHWLQMPWPRCVTVRQRLTVSFWRSYQVVLACWEVQVNRALVETQGLTFAGVVATMR